MILTTTPRPNAERTTLDQFAALHGQRMADTPALFDAPDRPLWSEGAPRRLTWGQIDTATSAIAMRLIGLGLSGDSVIAIQAPNSTDTLLAILGCLKANLVPSLMPLGWRNAEVAAAVVRIGARAIFTVTRAGPAHPADTLRHVAADNFSIRFVCAFGADVPDGVVPFEDCISETVRDAPRTSRLGNPAAHVAIITWDCGPGGYFPVARTHNECLAAGRSTIAGLALERSSALVSSLAPTGFAGLATGFLPWLISGSALALHHGFDATVLDAQIERHAVTHVVLPSVVMEAALREAILAGPALQVLASVSRRPDIAGMPLAPRAPIRLVEMAALGEIGLVSMTRGSEEAAPTIPLGRIVVPGLAETTEASIETGTTRDGALALRGATVPRTGFPGADRGAIFPADAEGWVSTGFPAVIEDGAIRVTGPRRDVVSIGGHALSLAGIESLYADTPGTLAVSAKATPDPILGERLVLEAVPQPGSDLSTISLAVHAAEKGVSPLAATADAAIGDRRKGARLAGAA